MRPWLPRLHLPILFLVAAPCAAQTLSSRPGVFADPLLMIDPAAGELVLGRTTLTAALRIFAVELADSVGLPRTSNPDTVGAGEVSGVPSMPKAYYRLDVGVGRYLLYFDRHERLVAAIADRRRLPRTVRREELVARYATLRVQHRGRSADGTPVSDRLIAPLGPCLSLSATVGEGNDGLRDSRHLMPGTVEELGYNYTCTTAPARQRAVLDKDKEP